MESGNKGREKKKSRRQIEINEANKARRGLILHRKYASNKKFEKKSVY